jgi:tetratricopeptide (TPR) repeat protein
MSIPVDSATVVNNGTVPKELANRIVKSIDWSPSVQGTSSASYLQKNDVMILDLLAHNNWKRPVYFAATAPASSYLNLAPYLQLEGLAYRLVPIKQSDEEGQQETRVATEIMYDNFMNKFKWGGMEKPGTFLDNVFLSSCVLNIRQRAGTLATALAEEGKKDKAIKVLDKCLEVTPFENCPIDGTLYSVVFAYYQAGANDKANALSKTLFDNYENNIKYIYSLKRDQIPNYGSELKQAQGIMEQLVSFAGYFKQEPLAKDFQTRYMQLVQDYRLPNSNRSRPQ